MDFKLLLDDEDAVSPVIGVILMVAITVILAAVIGTFVLGLGSQVQETAPNAQFDWDQSGGDLEVTHEGGPSIDPARLLVVVDTGSVENADCSQVTDWTGGSEVTAGSSCLVEDGSNGDVIEGTYRLTWSSEGGGQSSTLSTHEA